jgi:hypothetical protein
MVRFIPFVLLALSASAADRPEWVDRGGKAEDGVYRYYVGRSVAPTESESIADARSDAQTQIVRENFGSETQIELRSLENSRTSSTTKSMDETFPKVRFDGFEQQETFFERNAQGVEAWVLFRFPKTTIAKEKLRLAKLQPLAPEADWSSQGNAFQTRTRGALEVSSEPPGADVYIDDKRFGQTPIKLMGVLDPGAHEVRIEHPERSDYTEKVQLEAGQTVQVHKKLRKALAHLSITTTPSGAKLKVEGHPAGFSPMKLFPVSAGKSVAVEIRHDKALPLTTEVIVRKDRHETRHYTLELRAGADAAGEPRAVSAEFDSKVPTERRPRFELDGDAAPRERIIDERAMYSFSLAPLGYASASMESVAIPHAFFGGAFGVDVTPNWYWQFGYHFGQREAAYSNALVSAKFHRFSLATGWQVGLTAGHSIAVEALVMRLVGVYQLRYLSELQFRTAPSLSQWGWGGAMRYRWLVSSQSWGMLTTGWGIGAKLAAVSFTRADAANNGKSVLQGEFECFFHF